MKKSFRFIICVLFLVLLTGCQLAVPEEIAVDSNDQLIGVYLTTTSIRKSPELKISGDGKISWEQEEDNRVYGIMNEDKSKIIFDGVQGYVIADILTEIDHEKCITTIGDDVFYDMSVNCKDDDYEISVAAGFDKTAIAEYEYFEDDSCFDRFQKKDITTLYDEKGEIDRYQVKTGGEEIVVYLNPIYQTADNQFYMLPASQGMCLSEFGDSSMYYSNSTKEETNGISHSKNIKITITLKGVVPADEVIFTQYDMEGQELKCETYNVSTAPDHLTFLPDAAYIVAESTDVEGKHKWEIINQEDDYYYIFVSQKDKICSSYPIKIK